MKTLGADSKFCPECSPGPVGTVIRVPVHVSLFDHLCGLLPVIAYSAPYHVRSTIVPEFPEIHM
jgi:hypothetical protein